MDIAQLQAFIKRAASNTYASGAQSVSNPQRPGFEELTFEEGDFSYRDSYTGQYRSWGTELVRFKDKPVWNSLYGGGMVEGKENLDHETFQFLQKAFLKRPEDSFRGPEELIEGDFKYTYKQEGDISLFTGYEEIRYKGELVFFHRINGGLIV